MIYVLFSYILYPFLHIIASLRKNPAVKKILVIQTAKIGDMVCSTPVFREIKKQYPSVFIAVMGDPLSQSVLDNNPHINEFISLRNEDTKGFSGKLSVANNLRKGHFDISISLQPNVANNVIPLWALIPRRYSLFPNFYGLTFRCSSLLNTLNVPHVLQQSIVDTYCMLLNSIGVSTGEGSSKLELHPSRRAITKVESFSKQAGVQNDKLIGIAPASKNKIKELDPHTFAEIADRIQEAYNYKVVLIAGPDDRNIVDKVKKYMASDPIDSCGKFSLSELSALLERLSIFIGVDSAPLYMSLAMGVPSINIAGPCSVSDRPLGGKTIILQKKLPCVPCTYTFSTAEKCAKGDRECIASISVNEVMEAVNKILEKDNKKI
ncbi:MAG: glycosyltransferase family 9 protein [Nitrospirae bacterium]|nr:glycosyltransferase family 9 protein [Nitrospirota bacterium]